MDSPDIFTAWWLGSKAAKQRFLVSHKTALWNPRINLSKKQKHKIISDSRGEEERCKHSFFMRGVVCPRGRMIDSHFSGNLCTENNDYIDSSSGSHACWVSANPKLSTQSQLPWGSSLFKNKTNPEAADLKSGAKTDPTQFSTGVEQRGCPAGTRFGAMPRSVLILALLLLVMWLWEMALVVPSLRLSSIKCRSQTLAPLLGNMWLHWARWMTLPLQKVSFLR